MAGSDAERAMYLRGRLIGAELLARPDAQVLTLVGTGGLAVPVIRAPFTSCTMFMSKVSSARTSMLFCTFGV